MTRPLTDPSGPIEERLTAERYNYHNYRPRQVADEVRRTITAAGVPPDGEAPDFELPQADGPPLRLSRLRGQPVLIRFGSPS